MINILPVILLSLSDVEAEYESIRVAFAAIKKGKFKVPRSFTGEPEFFYDKVHYLEARVRELHTEIALRNREPKPDWYMLSKILTDNMDNIGPELRNAYTPKTRDLYMNMALIAKGSGFSNVKKVFK